MREGEKTDADDARVGAAEMRKRRTTLADGRYLIYYTFGEGGGGGAGESESEAARGPRARPQAEDERSV